MTRHVKINREMLLIFLRDNDRPDYEALSRQFNCSPNYLMRLKGQYEKQGLLNTSSLHNIYIRNYLSSILFTHLLTITHLFKSTLTKELPKSLDFSLFSFMRGFIVTLSKTAKEVSLCPNL